jgi:hypothetical protein
MLEVNIDKLPGGDAARRQCLARITLTNTGQGAGGVKTYEVRVTHIATDRGTELAATTCKTYREEDEGVLRLLHRALGRMLGDRAASR